MSDLQGLLARVEAATGPDRKLDEDIWKAFGGRFDLFGPRWIYADGVVATERWTWLTASIDAALVLVEKLMPGWCCLMAFNSYKSVARADVHPEPLGTPQNWPKGGTGKTLPLAILAGLLRAKIAMTGGGRDSA